MFSLSHKLSNYTSELDSRINFLPKVGARVLNLASTFTCLIDAIYHLAMSVISALNLIYISVKEGLRSSKSIKVYDETRTHFTFFIKFLMLVPFASIIGISPSSLKIILPEILNFQNENDNIENLQIVEEDCNEKTIPEAQHEKLKKIYDDAKKPNYKEESLGDRFVTLNVDLHVHGATANIVLVVDFLPDYEKKSKSIFLPKDFFPTNRNQPGAYPFNELKEYLSLAFASGKELVIARICNELHTALVAFRPDGKFKIIDSKLTPTIDINALTKNLNESNIKDLKGAKIKFKGKYINTELQKGGHECQRFASLYGYHMAKKNSFKAYKEVNGAFAEGRLNTFEDINKIDGSASISNSFEIDLQKYKSFMESWAYRSVGIQKDSWKDLTVKFLDENTKYDNGNTAYYVITSDQINGFDILPEGEFALIDGTKPEIHIIPNIQEKTLGSLITDENEKIVVIPRKNNDPLIYKLTSNQEVDGARAILKKI